MYLRRTSELLDQAIKKMKKRKIRPISINRPPLSKTSKHLSSKATRGLIRRHHNLSKAYTQAVKAGKDGDAARIDQQISEQGGLRSYQLASTIGQSRSRGGDSSKVLVQWLHPVIPDAANDYRIRVLEVGALSTNNACSKVPSVDVTRIDLHSQKPGIISQDFMQMPAPDKEDDSFDVISLSLVMNYVPDPEGRGDMLKKVPLFLSTHSSNPDFFPCVFLVLPAACICNSRYMGKDHLVALMRSIGLILKQWKLTSKLMYSLWVRSESPSKQKFPKKQLRSGASRNNFSIVLR